LFKKMKTITSMRLPNKNQAFQIENPDRKTSPFTGMGRDQWLAAGHWFLDGVFSNVPSPSAPLLLPKVQGKSYPHPDDPQWRHDCSELEAVVRSLNLAGPMLEISPDLVANGIAVGEYYKSRLLALTAPRAEGGLPRPDDLPEIDSIQITCETGGLSVILTLCPKFWGTFSSDEKNQIADFIASYAHARTGGHNWRYFNVMMLFFLLRAGYEADAGLLHRHLEALLSLHVGDGWFWDAHVDYYTHWVFQLYGSILQEHGEGIISAELLEWSREQSLALAPGYPRLFSRSGHMILWGRSICYRTGATSVLPWLCSGAEPLIDPGWARRIASGNLLQFITRDDFLENGVPSLGFYGHFEPVLQYYSCAGSPGWMHLTFLSALSQPADSPFWTAIEKEGDCWKSKSAVSLAMPGAAIRLVNYPSSGETEIQTSRVETTWGCEFSHPIYQHLAFHSRYPMEHLDPEQGMAMHYAWTAPRFFKGSSDFHIPFRNDWLGEEEGVLYRRLQMSNTVCGTFPYIDLAEMVLDRGILRMDRARVFHGDRMRLCHYALPHLGGSPLIERRRGTGWEAIIASTATDSLALVSFAGWHRLGHFTHDGYHPENVPSTVLYAEHSFDSPYPDCSLPFLTALLHRNDGKPWIDEDLQVVSSHSPHFINTTLQVQAVGSEPATIRMNRAEIG